MFRGVFALRRLAWLAICCLLVCGVDAQPCQVGFSGLDGGVCAQCVPGTYKNTTGSAVCTNCPTTDYDSFVGSISVDNCFICNLVFTVLDPDRCA